MDEVKYIYMEIANQYHVPKGTSFVCAFSFYRYYVPKGTDNIYISRICLKYTNSNDKEKSHRDEILVKSETPPLAPSPVRDGILKTALKTCIFLMMILFVDSVMGQDFELPDSGQVKELRIKKVTRTISSVHNDTLKEKSYEITNYDIEGKIISDSNFWFDKGYGKSADTVHNYIYKDGLLICDSALVISINPPKVYICKTNYFYNKKRQLIEWKNWTNSGWNYIYYDAYKIKMISTHFGKKQGSETYVYNPSAPFRTKTIQSELYQFKKYSSKSTYLYGYNENEKMVTKICISDSKSYFSYRIEKYKYDDNGAGNLIHSTMELQRSGGNILLEETIFDYSYDKETGLLKSKQVNKGWGNNICTYKYEFYPADY